MCTFNQKCEVIDQSDIFKVCRTKISSFIRNRDDFSSTLIKKYFASTKSEGLFQKSVILECFSGFPVTKYLRWINRILRLKLTPVFLTFWRINRILRPKLTPFFRNLQ